MTQNFNPDAGIDKTLRAIGKADDSNIVCLSTGVRLTTHQANPMMLISVMASNPRPDPPVQHNAMMGRDMENPDDPDYQERVKAWAMSNSNAVLNAFILLGTDILDKPDGTPGPLDDQWLEKFDALGLPTKPNNKSWRYLKWVLSVATANESDLALIRDRVASISGVKEADVSAAAEFPGRN